MIYEEIKNILGQITDPVDRLEFVMDLGKSLPAIPDGAVGTEIHGCASRVEIYRDGHNNYFGSVDSALVRGIVYIILSMVREIPVASLGGEFESLNLNLGAGRMNGVAAVIEHLVASKLVQSG